MGRFISTLDIWRYIDDIRRGGARAYIMGGAIFRVFYRGRIGRGGRVFKIDAILLLTF